MDSFYSVYIQWWAIFTALGDNTDELDRIASGLNHNSRIAISSDSDE